MAEANLPVAFGSLLAGALLLQHGVTTLKGTFGSSSTTAAGSVGTVNPCLLYTSDAADE